jgi:hypothetical protein
VRRVGIKEGEKKDKRGGVEGGEGEKGKGRG